MKTFCAASVRAPHATRWIRGLTLGLAALLLAACASTGQGERSSGGAVSAESSVDVLKTRAKERWDLLILGKALEAWEYLSPGYRQTREAQRYADDMRNRPTRWLSAGVNSVECESEDVCVVVVRTQFEAPVPGRSGGVQAEGWVRENWLRLDGTWYHVP